MPVRLTQCLIALALLCSPGFAGAQAVPPIFDEIVLPKGLSWQDNSDRLEARIEATKFLSAERRKIGSRWALVVTGFKEEVPPRPPMVTRMIFYFTGAQLNRAKGRDGKVKEKLVQGELAEIEYQYQEPGWTEERYGICLGQKRRYLEKDYGLGQQLIRSTTSTPDRQAAQTLVGYKWNKNNVAVELIYFHIVAKTGQQEFHTLSLHYKRS